jgi:hypothetical protein
MSQAINLSLDRGGFLSASCRIQLWVPMDSSLAVPIVLIEATKSSNRRSQQLGCC